MKGKSDNIKRVRKFFTIAEFEKEEKYLTDMAAQGWRFVDTNGYLYTFERCEPEQVVYRLDFSGIPLDQRDDYYAMFRDYGWEYLQDINGFSYFRKSADGVSPEDLEIFSDGASHLTMVKKVMLKKLIPLIGIFFFGFLQFVQIVRHKFLAGQPDTHDRIFLVSLAVIWAADLFMLFRVIADFLHLKKKYSKNE